MRTYKVLVAGTAVLALGLLFLTAGHAADDDAAKVEIDKLAALAGKDPAALHKKAEEYAKTLDSLEDVMNTMKKRSAGGWGVGPKPPAPRMDDGIEARIQNLGRRSPKADQLKKEETDLVQMANRVTAIGEIALAKTPKKKEGDKDPKDWKEYCEEMIKQSQALAKAFKAADPMAVKETANKLNASCTNCHGKFRD
jgi:hypothetical protein